VITIDSLYRYSGEILTEPEIINVIDHHYDEENHEWPVLQLIESGKVDPHSHTLLFDMHLHDDVFAKYKPRCIPLWCADEVETFKKQNIDVDWTNKTVPFNIMINKVRPHRIHLLQTIENLKLTNFTYSLPWQDNPYTNLAPTNYMIGTETQMPQGIKSGSITNGENYKQLLQKTVFEPSCISLITEPHYIEREALITEKTIMAVYGGTIPIWVGGWRCADAMRSQGFDVFDDIVDHSYQSLDNPWDRINKSIELNQELLSSFTISPSILKRLEHNLDLMLNGVFEREVRKQLDETNITLCRKHGRLSLQP